MELRLNLASRAYLDRRTVRRWLLLIGLLALLLLVANLIYGTVYLQQLNQVDARMAELDAKLVAQRSEKATAFSPESHARVMAQIEFDNQIITDDHFRWTALLSRFEEILPDSVAIRSIKPNYRDHSLQITGVARDTEALTELLDHLLASEDMHNTYLLSQGLTAQAGGGEELLQFSLNIQGVF
jgi:Tfp pilus assembly protein PilN